tara:strand:- start:2264 stop:3295 length:1032 start_codon:yes stop_codon:yes gene_type:complete
MMIINTMVPNYKILIKRIIIILIASSFLDFFYKDNPYLKTLASDNTGIDINFGDSIGVDQNIKNLRNRRKIYEKEIIEKVKGGGAIESKMGNAFFGLKSFFRENYCSEIGEYSIIGAVPYPTWCNRDNGPFSNVKNPNSVIIIPLTLELKSGFKENMIDTLSNGLQADYIGVIKGHNHKPERLTGPDFKLGQDQLLGIVNQSRKLMLLYEINDAGIYRNSQLDILPKKGSYDLAIDLINKKGLIEGGVSFGENKKTCAHHSKNCLLENIHLMEYQHKNHSPEIINDKDWGKITGELFPPHMLLKDYDSLQKIFLSSNYYLLIDINEYQLKNLSRVNVRKITNE